MANPCNHLTEQGVCIDAGTSEKPDDHTCQCSPMYAGKNCEIKLDEKCVNMPCNKFGDLNATCYEMRDEIFACKCSLAYGGYLCTNVDDCQGEPCQNGGKCVDGIDSFKCDCEFAWFMGKFCEMSKVCSKCAREGTLYCDSAKSECVWKETHHVKV